MNRRLAEHVDVMFGNEEDFSAALGFEVEGVGDGYDELDTASYVAMLERVVREYPNLKVVATSLRTVRSASANDWGGLVFANGRRSGRSRRPPRSRISIPRRSNGSRGFTPGPRPR